MEILSSRRLSSRLFALLILMIVTSSFGFSQTTTCGVTWDSIMQISQGNCFSVSPQLVAVGDTIHLIWFGLASPPCSTANYAGILYSHSYDGGQSFSPQVQLITYDSATGGNGHIAEVGEHVYISYVGQVDSPIYYNSAILRSTDAGATWQPRTVLGDYLPMAFTARDSNVYVLGVYDTMISGQRTKRAAMEVSGDFGLTWNFVSRDLQAPYVRGINHIVATDSGLNTVYPRLFNDAPFPYEEVIHRRSTDFGFSWSQPDTMSTHDSVTSQWPQICVSGNYVISCSWEDFKYGSIDQFHGSVLMRKSTDGGSEWGVEFNLSYTPTAIMPSLAADKNLVAVVWNEYVDHYHDRPLMRFSHDDGVTWCDTTQVAPLGGDVALAVAKSRFHIAWFDQGQIFYRRGQPITVGVTDGNQAPLQFSLDQNYPNPFNPVTRLRYELPTRSFISISVYDVLGRKLSTLVNGMEPAGSHAVQWVASKFPSGVYFYDLVTAQGRREVRKMLLIR